MVLLQRATQKSRYLQYFKLIYTTSAHLSGTPKDTVGVRKEKVKKMGSELTPREKKIYKVVLTGGPCGGKTTGQARLCSFFETLGWKVLRVPETATVLLGGGIKFTELTEEQGVKFQEELLRTMMQIENTFFKVAEGLNRDVLVICDRGTMDASAFIGNEQWEDILQRNNWNDIDIRDSRYNQVIHMVSAAHGAEPFYSIEDHACRSEGLDLARELDHRAAQAWVGHPYFDMIDNSTDFESKLNRMIESVCVRLGIDVADRLQFNARKVKFLVKGPLPPDNEFPVEFRDFTVIHNYLRSNTKNLQSRLRKRGHKNHWSYTHTTRRPVHGQIVEVKTTLSARDHALMLAQKDTNHETVYKTRRCFLWNDQYLQMDVYDEPCHPRCKGLILLETYTTLTSDELNKRLPEFLTIVKEVTGDPRYSMFNLSLKEGWENNQHFSRLLSSPSASDLTAKLSNGNSNSTAAAASASNDGNERNESFLACCDEKSIKHHLSNGSNGIGGSNGAGDGQKFQGTGKFKSYENGHSNGVPDAHKNGHKPYANGGSKTNGSSNGH